MSYLEQIVLVVVAAIPTLLVVFLAIWKFMSPLLQKQIEQATTHVYNNALETHKAGLMSNLEVVKASNELHNQVLGLVGTGYSISQERRLTSFSNMWGTVLRIRSDTALLSHPYAILLPEEYLGKDLAEVGSLGNALKQRASLPYLSEDSKVMAEIEEGRPFVGEKLWLLFHIYRAFALGLEYYVLKGVTEDNKLPDMSVFLKSRRSLLLNVLSEDEIDQSMYPPFVGINGILTVLEGKILHEMNRWIFGQGAIELTRDQQKVIAVS